MAGRWMDERDRWGRERNWRGRDDYGREADDGYEPRSFGEGARRAGPGRDRVFGERDTGAGYNRPTRPGGGYSGYGAGEGFRPGYGGGDWQDRDFQGVSPAMEQGEYELGRGAPRFQRQDYTRDYTHGGRFYGDDQRTKIYRDEYGTGGVEYGRVPRGYDAGRDRGYGARDSGGYGPGPERHRAHPAYGGVAEGGTGGYDYDRGYGDAGRGRTGDHHDFDDRMEQAGDFLHKAGRRVANWFRGDDLMDGSRPDGERGYRADDGRGRGARGLGPKGYKRSDERISDEAHERLTDDSWLDASNIGVSVSGGEVTLSGTVESREAKHRAERLVEDISGVGHVQNNLRVDRGDVLTGSGHGFGDSAAEAQMRRDEGLTGGKTAQDPAATRTTTRRT